MTVPDQISETELLRRMRAGDEEAFRSIYQRCQGPIYRFVLHMTGRVFIAEDVTQEVFMTLIQGPVHFDASRGSLPAYLFGMGRKLLLRRLESDKVFVSLVQPDEPGDAHGNGFPRARNETHPQLVTMPVDLLRHQQIARVKQAIHSLPAHYREIVVLCDLSDMSYEDAARILDCAVGTVRSRLHRARTMLVEKLRELREPAQKIAAGGEAQS
jgi:RNA polymerase sigma-70 factor (ECF subfamily)